MKVSNFGWGALLAALLGLQVCTGAASAAVNEPDSLEGFDRAKRGEAPMPGLPFVDAKPTPGGALIVSIEELLLSVGFDDVILFDTEQLTRFGDSFAAGWQAKAGDLVGLMYVVPAEEPRDTIGSFVEEVADACGGRFDGGLDSLDVGELRSVGRAKALCQSDDRDIHYDMIFYFLPEATIGISHFGLGKTRERAGKINNGLMKAMQSW